MFGVRTLVALCVLSTCTVFVTSLTVPVNVMMPLELINRNGDLNDPQGVDWKLGRLREAGVAGVMVDTWWGIVEHSPQQYDFHGYRDFINKAKSKGLTVQAVMSFHRCGGNVGDTCDIPLPDWITGKHDWKDIFYTDKHGQSNPEYISLGADTLRIFEGRTPIEIYRDFIQAYMDEFADELGTTITELQIGAGPAGELRYPSYPGIFGFHFPGTGALQCYDNNMRKSLQAAAEKAGEDWGNPPSDAGDYNSRPENEPFWREGYASDYGRFFLDWYFGELLHHGDRLLAAAKDVIGNKVDISIKVAGIHWLYNDYSHAAEVTAGYYNTNGRNGYYELAQLFHKYGAYFCFTCLEMRNSEQDQGCEGRCRPEQLVWQTLEAAKHVGVGYAGENALPRYDKTAYDQIIYQSFREGPIHGFTYLRLDDNLLSDWSFNTFKDFVWRMKTGARVSEDDEGGDGSNALIIGLCVASAFILVGVVVGVALKKGIIQSVIQRRRDQSTWVAVPSEGKDLEVVEERAQYVSLAESGRPL